MKKVNPFSVVIYIIVIIAIGIGGLCIFGNRLPEGLIVIGCAVILSVLPVLLKPAEKSAILCSYEGRCRIGDTAGKECSICITETDVAFLNPNGKKIIVVSRTNIDSVEIVNSHTVAIIVQDAGTYKFICNNADTITHVYRILCCTT